MLLTPLAVSSISSSFRFSADLYGAGFPNVVNVDISEVCIAQMKERYKHLTAMTWQVMGVGRALGQWGNVRGDFRCVCVFCFLSGIGFSLQIAIFFENYLSKNISEKLRKNQNQSKKDSELNNYFDTAPPPEILCAFYFVSNCIFFAWLVPPLSMAFAIQGIGAIMSKTIVLQVMFRCLCSVFTNQMSLPCLR